MTAYDSPSFSAGQDCGTRVAACVARLSALELMSGSSWWNRRRRRLMASALVACADELESTADADGPRQARQEGAAERPWTPPSGLSLRVSPDQVATARR